MKYVVFIFIWMMSITFFSCQRQATFPDRIDVTKTASLKRIKGTKLFVAMPENYRPIENLVRIQRDVNTYLQVMEIPGSDFNEYKETLTKEFIESKGAKVDIVQPLKYNNYEAIYFSGPSKTPGETKIGLAFGDATFTVIIAGVYQTTDTKAKDELNQLLRTSYYDQSFALDPFELVNFTFDEKITGFKLAFQMGNGYIYSPNGAADQESEEEQISIFKLSTIEAATFADAKEHLDYILSRYPSEGIDILKLEKKDIMINGNPAYTILLELKDEQQATITVYHAIIHKGHTAVLFIGSDSENGKWLERFKQTAESIKM